MDTKDEEFLKRLQETFRIEAEEHIRELTSGLLELEKLPEHEKNPKLVETIFREAHSLKGAARSVNMRDIELICHAMESLFRELKNERISLTTENFDLIHKGIKSISTILLNAGKNILNDSKEIIKQLQSILLENQIGTIVEEKQIDINTNNTIPPNSTPIEEYVTKELVSEENPVQSETVRIPIAKIDPLFLQAEQMIQSKIAANQRVEELKDTANFINTWKTKLKKWDLLRSSNDIVQIKEVYDWNNENLNVLETNLKALTQAFENDQRLFGRMVDEHVESMKSVLMLPVSIIVEGFPKFVRDLTRNQGKDAELIVNGKEIEVDKRILEELKDPLIHLIRNCIDHGIKKTEEQENLNKPSHATITLSFSATESRYLEILISDDGVGIDLENVRKAALKSGMIDKKNIDKLSDQETLMLIFQSGVSTSQIITDISGRGLGLAIVKEKVEKLGGSVFIESQSHKGTTFRLLVPLSLATFRGVLVRMGEYLSVIPTINIERAIRVRIDDIKTVKNKETIMIDGKILKVVHLGNALGLSVNKNPTIEKSNDTTNFNMIQVVILAHTNERIAFIVDEVLNEYQILVKDLGKQLNRVRNISGATVLGSGKVVPVIHVPDVMKSANRIETFKKETKEIEKEAAKKYKILVVDDSITSRSFIKNILESAGYVVESAFDGVDAYTKALVGSFDLVVSDVDMPRMNGFELTSKLRNDKKLSELPVVLVTALESREDREHGIDVGANAYIIKSSFDQSNLLEVMKKLL
jgi:two-component system chemotaxis sensor kinase CheA